MTLAREAAPLIAAACAAPDDEAPRRALAAWLTARGHALGAFMTLQLDRHRTEARLARPQPQPALAEVSSRAAAERAWIELVPALGKPRRFALVRGMPEALTVAWDELGASWLAELPLAHLDVTGEVPGGGLAPLVALSSRIESLALTDTGLDDDATAQLAAAPWPRLRWIDLSRNRIDERGAEALVASRTLERLILADLTSNLFNPTEAALDAHTLGEVGPERHDDAVRETRFSPRAEAMWRRHGEPSWCRVLWRRAAERPHRWHVWEGLPERDLTRDDLEGAVVLGGRLDGIRGAGARWRAANLAASAVGGGDFTEADLADASFARGAVSRTSFARALARRLDLRDARLTDCDLAGADLREAWLERAVITDCRLRGARLGCDDQRRDLGRTRGARFVRCDLRDVELDGRELIDVELIDCQLAGLRGTPWSTERSVVRRGDLSPAADGSRMIGEAPLADVLGAP